MRAFLHRFGTSHHHHHQVWAPDWSTAISTMQRSYQHLQAESLTPLFAAMLSLVFQTYAFSPSVAHVEKVEYVRWSRGQWANPGLPGRWPLSWCVHPGWPQSRRKKFPPSFPGFSTVINILFQRLLQPKFWQFWQHLGRFLAIFSPHMRRHTYFSLHLLGRVAIHWGHNVSTVVLHKYSIALKLFYL